MHAIHRAFLDLGICLAVTAGVGACHVPPAPPRPPLPSTAITLQVEPPSTTEPLAKTALEERPVEPSEPPKGAVAPPEAPVHRPGAWSASVPGLQARIANGKPLVVRVIVPLCSNAQINCGEHGLGDAGSLRTNLYWGALFGVDRFFRKPSLGYQALDDQPVPNGVMARRVYRKFVSGHAWGAPSKVETLVVLDAVHGSDIVNAVKILWRVAGGRESAVDINRPDGASRRLEVAAVGYAGHNALMDVPIVPKLGGESRPVPSFVFACLSEAYFDRPLRQLGAQPLVMTRAYIAPEGYAVTAAVGALAQNLSTDSVREQTVRAYAKWQKISPHQAGRLFAP